MLGALLAVVLLPCCVKQGDYEILQTENQQLQARIDQLNRELQQKQAELGATQRQLLQTHETQAELQKTRGLLIEAQAEIEALRTEFAKFRTQRRNAMIGKKYPVLNLANGKVLHEAQITTISADEISIRHDSGFLKVAMADTNEDLRWEACYDPQEAKDAARAKLLAEARALEINRGAPAPPAAPVLSMANASLNAATVLRSQLTAQRKQLNDAYQALRSKNPAAFRGVEWSPSSPEASPLLNTLSGSRAVLGLSRLQEMRDAIIATLRRLRDVDPSAR